MTYAEKLKDPRWQKKRLEILNLSAWKCEDCGDHEMTLEVHHCGYGKGLEPWQYTVNTLMALCSKCHKERQSLEDNLKACLACWCRGKSLDEINRLLLSLGCDVEARPGFIPNRYQKELANAG